jgi:hypothetical protein
VLMLCSTLQNIHRSHFLKNVPRFSTLISSLVYSATWHAAPSRCMRSCIMLCSYGKNAHHERHESLPPQQSSLTILVKTCRCSCSGTPSVTRDPLCHEHVKCWDLILSIASLLLGQWPSRIKEQSFSQSCRRASGLGGSVRKHR